jgi:hypothetical protein
MQQQQQTGGDASLGSAQADLVRTTARRLVERIGRDAAIRVCRSNMWLGVLAEIERSR